MDFNSKKFIFVNKIVYVILSVCLFALILVHTKRMADQVTTPIFYHGASLYPMEPVELNRRDYFSIKGVFGCDGVWDCSKQICKISEKYMYGSSIVAINLNFNINESSCGDIDIYEYDLVKIMILVSICTSSITYLGALVIIIRNYVNDNDYNNNYRDHYNNEINNDIIYKNDDAIKSCSKFLDISWVILLVLKKVCMFTVFACLWYLIQQVQSDTPPKYIQNLEYVELFVMLGASMFDGFLLLSRVLL